MGTQEHPTHREVQKVSKYAEKLKRGEMMFGGRRQTLVDKELSKVDEVPMARESTNPSNCLVGVVVSKGGKGFGYIRTDDGRGAERLYFHNRGCRDPFEKIRIGNRVSYTLGSNKYGPIAENVKRHFE